MVCNCRCSARADDLVYSAFYLTLRSAMPGTKKPIEKLAVVEYNSEVHTAHIQYRDEAEKNMHIRGPRRVTNTGATYDLVQMCDAGAVGRTREEGCRS